MNFLGQSIHLAEITTKGERPVRWIPGGAQTRLNALSAALTKQYQGFLTAPASLPTVRTIVAKISSLDLTLVPLARVATWKFEAMALSLAANLPGRIPILAELNFSEGCLDESKSKYSFASELAADACGRPDSRWRRIGAAKKRGSGSLFGRILSYILVNDTCKLYLCCFGASDDRAEDQYGESMAGVDPDRQHRSDAEHREKTDLVDCFVLHSVRGHCDVDTSMDGHRGSSKQAQLVGHIVDRPRSKFDCAGLSGLVGLVCKNTEGLRDSFRPRLLTSPSEPAPEGCGVAVCRVHPSLTCGTFNAERETTGCCTVHL